MEWQPHNVCNQLQNQQFCAFAADFPQGAGKHSARQGQDHTPAHQALKANTGGLTTCNNLRLTGSASQNVERSAAM